VTGDDVAGLGVIGVRRMACGFLTPSRGLCSVASPPVSRAGDDGPGCARRSSAANSLGVVHALGVRARPSPPVLVAAGAELGA